ncbi:hypothetical protein [Janthinobacterium sp. PAMC25594]|jgi:hypothetical protein|uniref:hypothetical protein n=1 Tax=Janthinobacterium sp. PAMC25594 TaxID=2861284 RepID=UPI001C634D2A|nr:hypothetical protein [Janthinobacterium sp. PAMC25594]QYG07151.1 hypothetical protein KY494_28885 [Janthinobacterium sp. PAMC25594]
MGQRAFAVFLQELRDGRTHIELTTALADLLGKVKDTGKAGSITLQIGVKPAGKGADVDKVVIMDKITTKLPTPERGEDFYWLTDDNDLSRNHPKQSTLDLREAAPTAPLVLKEATK